jgi:LuxR family transcriptional regulator, maltose regulon positive regulatory protein
MATEILATKLYIPPPPPKMVLRSRLVERLSEGLHRKLTLISAPAGFGKTTLVSEWIAGRRQQCEPQACVAWLSLDEGDGDPLRFLTYILAALRTTAPDMGEEVLAALHSPQPPPVETILTALLNEINSLQSYPATGAKAGFILVLDDYHLIEARPVDDALTFLVEHLPPQMHLVITTREDPSLPIPRLRARGQVVELRAADLRFTPSEAAEFLNQVMDLDLSPEEVAALEARTEGWIAGMQLAAISMKGHQDVHGFIQAFAGDHGYIVDYLVDEVLRCQPEPVRSFLLQTAILDRLSGPLCDAVTGQPGGKARLETLQRRNFFIIPLDDKRQWYRYHHLFADVLRMHLMAEQPDQVPALYRRASEWYEQNGMVADAICHLLAARDFERAATLIERAVPEMRQNRQESILLDWLQALPDGLFQNRPVLSLHYAGTLLQTGRLDGVETRLRDAERWLDTPEDARERPIFVDEEDFRRLPGSIAMYYAGIALVRGDVADSIKYARQVNEIAPPDDDFLHGAASALLGLAYWTDGDLETAHRTYAKGMAYLQRIGYISDVIGGSVTLADIRITQGRLSEALSTYQRGLQLATKPGSPALRGAADMHVGLSELYRERNALDTAAQHLLKSKELGELNELPKNPYRWRVGMARIRAAQGNLDSALDLLDEAEPLYVADFSPNVRPISALKARVWVAYGKLGKALDWAREQGLSAEDKLCYLREFEHVTLARILLAQYKSDGSKSSIREAMGLLERLLKAAEEGGRMGSAIEIRVLQALAHQALGDISAALLPLQQALTLAEPEGYMRMFVDEGPRMAELLREGAARGIMPGYTAKLLAAFAGEQPTGVVQPPASIPQSLIEPLSQRELEVLRLFNTELSGPEIARELVVALSTVRTHTKSIYTKLNVDNRRAAVRRAVELGLI